ncbi:hypothetical protein [Sphingobium lactosutens]|uniref:hypothetical protein n=1 Tax=Sphingobium lactosutens TaxID=522773 RepID=UPI0021197243|nr:hypothetical protein [Sphingobium lactosutens]
MPNEPPLPVGSSQAPANRAGAGIDPALATSLKAVGSVMSAANDRWWIIASAAVALHGADAGRVADVDVLLSVDDALRILPAIGVEARRDTGSECFRSDLFGTWREAPLPVEFMAGFRYRSTTGWREVQPETRCPVQVDGVTLFIPNRLELQQLLAGFGRPKDRDRGRSLAALA